MSWPTMSDISNFYGDPTGDDGEPSKFWQSTNLRHVVTPWKMRTSWDGKVVSVIRVHRKCALSLTRVFGAIWEAAQKDQSIIQRWGVDRFGGAYVHRVARGSGRLSTHSWGCAIDLDPERNRFGDHSPNFAKIPEVLEAFAGEGWAWGGRWSGPDGMHWEAIAR